jgi:hypothetical protein
MPARHYGRGVSVVEGVERIVRTESDAPTLLRCRRLSRREALASGHDPLIRLYGGVIASWSFTLSWGSLSDFPCIIIPIRQRVNICYLGGYLLSGDSILFFVLLWVPGLPGAQRSANEAL